MKYISTVEIAYRCGTYITITKANELFEIEGIINDKIYIKNKNTPISLEVFKTFCITEFGEKI